MAPICEKLFKAKGKAITSKSFPKKSGIYTINEGNMVLYAGMTNNLKRRIQEHRRGNTQCVDLYLAAADTRDIKVKYTPVKNPGSQERKFINCIRKKKGRYSLPLNLTRGNTVSKKKRPRHR
jgi:predicted GIY-YIG superfamily endonuclease